MSKNLNVIVENILKKEEKYISENKKILKTNVYKDIINMDKDLIASLISDTEIKKEFFINIDDILVFDKKKFIWFLESTEFLPNSYTSYKNKIGLIDKSRNYLMTENDIVLSFPFKDCILKGEQFKDSDKSSEVMYNELIASNEIRRILAPKVFTNAKRYTKNNVEENIEFKEKDNLIIKGNNLIVLASLLERYEGKIKCIYIDPPYNTGSDSFNYNDSFKHSTWLVFMKNRLEFAKRFLNNEGVIFVQCDDNEQAYLKVLMDEIFGRENFVREITWLKGNAQNDAKNIQKNTESILVYTKNQDRGIYKEIKYSEVEIFQDNERYFYKGSGITTGGAGGTLNARVNLGATIYFNPITKDIIAEQDYDIEKAKTSNIENEIYKDNTELLDKGYLKIRPPKKNEKLGAWTWSLDKINNEKDKLLINYKDGKASVFKKEFLEDIDESLIIKKKNKLYYKIKIENPAKSFIEISSALGTNELKAIFNKKVFENPKSEELIEKLLSISTKEGDIVLDYHLGSGTTTATAQKMNRKYIGIEQMDYIENITVERMKKVLEGEQGGISETFNWKGGGSFVYCELKEETEIFIPKILNADKDSIFYVKNEIYKSEKIIPYISKNELEILDKDFDILSLEDKKKILLKLVDKNKLYVNLSDMEDETYNISLEDKKFNKSFYKLK